MAKAEDSLRRVNRYRELSELLDAAKQLDPPPRPRDGKSGPHLNFSRRSGEVWPEAAQVERGIAPTLCHGAGSVFVYHRIAL